MCDAIGFLFVICTHACSIQQQRRSFVGPTRYLDKVGIYRYYPGSYQVVWICKMFHVVYRYPSYR